jgi:hypothetical protein
MLIKKFQENDKSKVLELFEKVFHKKMTEQFWNWRFGKNPFGKPFVRLAFIEKNLVANYLLHPVILEINNCKKKCLFSMTTMIDSNYSGKGIMTKLATEAYDKGKDELYNIVFGFANKNSRHMFTKKLDFKELTVIKELTLEYKKKEFNVEGKIIKIDKFDEEFDFFFESQKNNLPKINIPRISSYLNWRFIENPITKYYCYKIEDEKKIVGYFVISKYKNKCQIVDFLVEENEKYFAQIIKSSLEFCKDKKCENISLWINRKLIFFRFLKSVGFYEKSLEIYFCVKTLNNLDDKINYLKFDNWFITMSDSDVY